MNKRITTTANRLTLMIGASLLALAAACNTSQAYERYNSGCQTCHGSFTGSTSPQGTSFPSGDKHRMHRNSNNMGTDCVLCHRSDDNDDPFIGSSDGVAACTAWVARAAMWARGCADTMQLPAPRACYGPAPAATEQSQKQRPRRTCSRLTTETVTPSANNPGNTALVANTNENWSVGDFIGLDNDGNNLYDLADFAIGGRYRILSTATEGNNVRVTWQTAGGRKDAIQASGVVNGVYSNISITISNPGVGLRTTNYLDVGAVNTKSKRFYRVVNVP